MTIEEFIKNPPYIKVKVEHCICLRCYQLIDLKNKEYHQLNCKEEYGK